MPTTTKILLAAALAVAGVAYLQITGIGDPAGRQGEPSLARAAPGETRALAGTPPPPSATRR